MNIMKRIIILILFIGLIVFLYIYPSISLWDSWNSEYYVFRRIRVSTVDSSLVDSATDFFNRARDFLTEIYYKMNSFHPSSSSLSDAIYNIELGICAGVEKHLTEVSLRSVDKEEYAIALVGLKGFEFIYGKLKDARIGSLIKHVQEDFQIIITTSSEEDRILKERMCGEKIWKKLTNREKRVFMQIVRNLSDDEKKSFVGKVESIENNPELFVFFTLFAISSERNFIRYRGIDKLRERRQMYEVFTEAVIEEAEGFNPTERVISLLAEYGFVDHGDKKGTIDVFVGNYFLSGSDVPATSKEIGEIFVEGARAPTGSYSVVGMLDAIVEESVRIRKLLESYGIEVDGFVENVYPEIALKMSVAGLNEREKGRLVEEFNRAIGNIDRWRGKLAETGSDDIKDELVEIAKAKAEQEGIPNFKLQDFIDDFIYQKVKLGSSEGELVYVVQSFVRWILHYRFDDGATLTDRSDNLMYPEVARRATRMAMFMIFDAGPKDYLGRPLQ